MLFNRGSGRSSGCVWSAALAHHGHAQCGAIFTRIGLSGFYFSVCTTRVLCGRFLNPLGVGHQHPDNC